MKKIFKNKKILFLVLALILILILSLSFFSGCFKKDFISKFSKNVSSYNIDVNINEKEKTLLVKQTTKFYNNKNVSLKDVHFHIYPKAFSEGVINKPVSSLNEQKAYTSGVNYGSVEITNVKLANKTLSPRYLNVDKDILVVDLEKELKPNNSTNIYFEYTLKLPNINHRYGYGDNTINLGNFYLIASVYDEKTGWADNSYNYNGDPFYSEIANYYVSVEYSSNFVLAHTGNEESKTTTGDRNKLKIKALAVRDFALILSDKYKVLKEKYNGINVNYFYYNDKTPEKSLKTSVDSLKTFIKLFGEYPYKNLNVCESNFVYGGMEYPNLVFISDNLDNYEDYTHTIVHEIAHQWWYSLVGNNEFKYGFLDESLTEYSTYLFYDENPSYNMDTREMIKNTTNSYLLFLDVYKEVFTKVDTSMLRSLDEFKTEPEYIYMAYVKGTLMYDNLKEIIGTQKFIKSLKYYYKQNRGKNVVPTDLINAFNKVTKKNLDSYFNSWLNGTVVIESI